MASPGSVDAYDFSILIIRDKWDFSLGEIVGGVLPEEVSEKGESKGSREHREGLLGGLRGAGEGD